MKADMPPIKEIFGTLIGIDMDPDDGYGYILISYEKSNRLALMRIVEDLKEWEDREVYIQFRVMTKREGK